ncbi:uncharacterized protein LOC126746910 [Anthonomus grandis grandis]|uniref:uncharacterized protein LOC126746910 n=1 Tax=Anthonomus grandis grandis TaxID=2921223 RepID=UPI0021655962|nr:uncharacterized protein LOC126746910 [Anthonomus grandis grandis]
MALESKEEAINRQLLENQSFLYTENQRLQENVMKLSKHLQELRKSTVDPKVLEHIIKEKNQLFSLNECLKQKINTIKAVAPGLKKEELEKQENQKQEILKSIEELDTILAKINERPEPFEISLPQESTVSKLCHTLTTRLEEEQYRSDQALETIRRLRDDDEKLILKDKISDMKQLISDLEVENTKLKFEAEQLNEDLQRYKKMCDEQTSELTNMKKEKFKLEDERDELKDKISELENEKLKLKKDMIEELTEANRAKRVCADTEIALQHISEAYENKRKESARLQKQLDEANTIIGAFRDQFDKNPNDLKFH